jgi:hypothetical protein
MAEHDTVTDGAHPARIYDYYLGGNDHYEVDRLAGEQAETALPSVRIAARNNRLFMRRSARWLAEAGIRQFLDLGSGIPTRPNLHQVVQEVAPDSRVVYVDNDPLVRQHAEAMLNDGRTAFIEADVRSPETITESRLFGETLDLDKPVALILNAMLQFVLDEQRPYEIVRGLVDALPSGSYLVLSHTTGDFDPEKMRRIVEVYRTSGIPAQLRSRAEVARFFEGLTLIEPGIVATHRWRPEGDPLEEATDADVAFWAGVAIKR